MGKRATFLVSLVVVLFSIVNAPADLVAHWNFEGDFGDVVGGNDATAQGDTDIILDPERGRR